jgi:hypothetical protein
MIPSVGSVHTVALVVLAALTWPALLAVPVYTAAMKTLPVPVVVVPLAAVECTHIAAIEAPPGPLYPSGEVVLVVGSVRSVVAKIARVALVQAAGVVMQFRDVPILVKLACAAKSFSEVCYPSAISYIRTNCGHHEISESTECVPTCTLALTVVPA